MKLKYWYVIGPLIKINVLYFRLIIISQGSEVFVGTNNSLELQKKMFKNVKTHVNLVLLTV